MDSICDDLPSSEEESEEEEDAARPVDHDDAGL